MIKFTDSHRIIHFWGGTDALKLVCFPPTKQYSWYLKIIVERILWKILEPLTREHWIDHEDLAADLISFGIKKEKISIHSDPIWPDKLEHGRDCHLFFSVAYYRVIDKNQVFKDWLYGYDIIEHLKKLHPAWNWMEIRPTHSKRIILWTLRCSDVYIRPNRHDGNSRLAEFCRANNIPVWHSRKLPNMPLLNRWLENEELSWKADFDDLTVREIAKRSIKSGKLSSKNKK